MHLPAVIPKLQSLPYQVSDRVLTWTAGSLSTGLVELAVEEVRNPEVPGGTGNFALSTYKAAYEIEANPAFGSIGISLPPQFFLASELNTKTGVYTQTYSFSVTTALQLKLGAWFRVNFPAGYRLNAALKCAINAASLNCKVQE